MKLINLLILFLVILSVVVVAVEFDEYGRKKAECMNLSTCQSLPLEHKETDCESRTFEYYGFYHEKMRMTVTKDCSYTATPLYN